MFKAASVIVRSFKRVLSSCVPSLPVGLSQGSKKFLNDTAGATAVELALILLPFFGLLGATFDAAMLYFRTTQLQMTTERVAREILVSDVDNYQSTDRSNLTYRQYLDQKVCPALGTMFDCSQLMMRVFPYAGWVTATNNGMTPLEELTWPPQSGRFQIPPADYVAVVRIGYPVKSFFNFVGKNINWIEGVAVFRVEPGAAQQ